jgi:hypothetical protein
MVAAGRGAGRGGGPRGRGRLETALQSLLVARGAPVRASWTIDSVDEFKIRRCCGTLMSVETWCSPGPEHTASLLAGAGVPWWFAGGWAIELFVGKVLRRDSDVDIGCFRDHFRTLLGVLPVWVVYASAGGNLIRMERGTVLDPAHHTLWCRAIKQLLLGIEILVGEMEGQDWVYRRDRRIRRPTVPGSWLADNIAMTSPRHAWLSREGAGQQRDAVLSSAGWAATTKQDGRPTMSVRRQQDNLLKLTAVQWQAVVRRSSTGVRRAPGSRLKDGSNPGS